MEFAGIYEEKKVKPTEKKFYLKLEKSSDGESINVVAVDEIGVKVQAPYLIKITKKGIERHHCVNSTLGFNLDKSGRLVVGRN